MNEDKVHHTDPNAREDLKHTDTYMADERAGEDPAGYEQSINPLGEVPASDEAGISERVGNDPSNLGDDIPDQGDLVHPAPVNAPVGKMPGM